MADNGVTITLTAATLAAAMRGCCVASGTKEHAQHVLDRLGDEDISGDADHIAALERDAIGRWHDDRPAWLTGPIVEPQALDSLQPRAEPWDPSVGHPGRHEKVPGHASGVLYIRTTSGENAGDRRSGSFGPGEIVHLGNGEEIDHICYCGRQPLCEPHGQSGFDGYPCRPHEHVHR